METQARYFFPIQVRYADTDAQGHVFFANYFTYFDEAAGGYFRAVGFPWEALPAMGLDIFYVDAQCQYKGSARYGERLRVYARAERVGTTSLTIGCRITPEGDEATIAEGRITAVIVDPQTRRPARVPDALRQAIAAFEGNSGDNDDH